MKRQTMLWMLAVLPVGCFVLALVVFPLMHVVIAQFSVSGVADKSLVLLSAQVLNLVMSLLGIVGVLGAMIGWPIAGYLAYTAPDERKRNV